MDTTTATITMEPETAKEAFEQYAESVRKYRDSEKAHLDESQRRVAEIDAALAQGYKALAAGHSLLKLDAAMATGGFDEKGLPKLAIVRAHAEKVFVEVRGPSRNQHNLCNHDTRVWRCQPFNPGGSANVVFSDRPNPAPNNDNDVVRLTMDYSSALPVMQGGQFQAIVPTVPPQYRPGHHLRNFHILFEPVWNPSRAPHPDPILLKHLRADLYAVLATWDMTALEAAVLGR